MKSFDFYAVTYDADVYCVNCLPDRVDVNSEDVGPIFADSEWDSYPVCGHCRKVHDYVNLTADGRETEAFREEQETGAGAMNVFSFDPVRLWESDGFRLFVWDTHRKADRPRTIHETYLAYRLYDDNYGNGYLVFEGSDFLPSPMSAIDSDQSIGALLDFLSLQPGDTDPDYFGRYTAEQLEWCQDRGEDLSILAIELEESARGRTRQ